MRVVHYLNQFFGQIGSEKEAGMALTVKEQPVGPGLAVQQALGGRGEIVATVICGDNHFAENLAAVTEQIRELLEKYRPDVVIAGPAFNAGRYGLACGAVCETAYKSLRIPAITGLYPDNPTVDLYKRFAYIVPTGVSAAGMREAVTAMAALAEKAVAGSVGTPAESGYLPRGVRKNTYGAKTGAERGIDMLLAKIKGEAYRTEYPMPAFSRVAPAAPVAGIAEATIAVMTTGGIVPKGNPDAIEACFATKYAKYDLEEWGELTAFNCETAHGGYDPTFANEDPNRILPVDVLRDLEREGVIGRLYEKIYVTVGNGMAVDRAEQFGRAIAREIKEEGRIDGVILTST